MASKDTAMLRKIAAIQAMAASGRLPKVATASCHEPGDVFPRYHEELDEATAAYLSEHKGNVLLEDVKPGQMVLLNVTNILNKPFVFCPRLERLEMFMRETLNQFDPTREKDKMIQSYNELRKEVLDVDPRQLQKLSAKGPEHFRKLYNFLTHCELLAVLRHISFDEPIPLIDIPHGTDKSQGGETSTKARQIGKPSKSNTSQTRDGSGSSGSKNHETQDEEPWGLTFTEQIPLMKWFDDKMKMVVACYPDDLRAPARIIVSLMELLNVEGWLVTSNTFMAKSVDYFKQRLHSEKPTLQQESRVALQACKDFINQEGITRNDKEWRQFVANGVDMLALRHVLHGKPINNMTQRDDDIALGIMSAVMELATQKKAVASARNQAPTGGLYPKGSMTWEPGHRMMSFDDLKDTDDVRVFMHDACGVLYGTITSGALLKQLEKRAKRLCGQDLAAAKLFFTELSKSCQKTEEEVNQLRNKAKIGIPQSVTELKTWNQNCLYWCVLRKVLHNVPLEAVKGRGGIPKSAGLKLAGKEEFKMHS